MRERERLREDNRKKAKLIDLDSSYFTKLVLGVCKGEREREIEREREFQKGPKPKEGDEKVTKNIIM